MPNSSTTNPAFTLLQALCAIGLLYGLLNAIRPAPVEAQDPPPVGQVIPEAEQKTSEEAEKKAQKDAEDEAAKNEAAKDKAAKDKAAKDKAAKDKAAKDKAAKDKATKDKATKDKAAKDKAAKDKAAKDKAAKNISLDNYLKARCLTAFCFDACGTENWLGIEPLVELPVGKAFALGDGSLNDHVNSHGFRVELAAGLRVWVLRDFVSLSIYLSTPLSDDPVRLNGIAQTFPSSSIRRPYPGVALGVLYDMLWIGFDYDELRNGDGANGTGYSNLYPPNEVIAGALVVSVAIQPLTALRTLLGTLGSEKKNDDSNEEGKL